MRKVIALILCRGNSKGIKNKNMKNFYKRPLIYWSIKSLKESNLIKSIYLSTDSKKILNYGLSQKIKVIKRPAKLSTSKSKSEDAIYHAIKNINEEFNDILFIQVTSPLRPKNIFDKVIKFYFKKKYDSLFSANNVNKIFFWKKNKNKLIPKFDLDNRKMRQEIKDIQLENGSFYIFNKKGFLKSKNRLFGKIGSYIIDKIYSHDIDEILDLKINEFIKKTYRLK
tara:strand:+ start:478 stop:1152 length:675 start_codon:yes stop_codon:yes gene_type:complete